MKKLIYILALSLVGVLLTTNVAFAAPSPKATPTPVTAPGPSVSVSVGGDSPNSSSEFTFTLTPQDPSNPMPGGGQGGSATISLSGSGSGTFGSISFVKPGTYVYKLTQNNNGTAGYTYDNTEYVITYVVTEVDGKLVVNSFISPSDDISFANTYKAPSTSGTGAITSGGGSASTSGGNASSGGGLARAAASVLAQTGDIISQNWLLLLAVIACLSGVIVFVARRRDSQR